MADQKYCLSITTDRELILTDPQTPEQVRLLSQDVFACMSANRPVRVLRNGSWRYLNTRYIYSWHTTDADTGDIIPNA